MSKKMVFVLISLSLVLAACAPSAAAQDRMIDQPNEAMEKPTDTMMEKPTEEMMAQDTAATPELMMEDGMMEEPAWFGAKLTNVRSGEDFTINDLKGKVVLVETLAMWCPNCKKQQMQVQSLHAMLGEMNSDVVTIGLDIDPNENAADLKAYTDANGFDWLYAIAPADVSREIGSLYGEQFLNPPSTPILVIDRQGLVHPLPFGIKGAEELKESIAPFLNEGM